MLNLANNGYGRVKGENRMVYGCASSREIAPGGEGWGPDTGTLGKKRLMPHFH